MIWPLIFPSRVLRHEFKTLITGIIRCPALVIMLDVAEFVADTMKQQQATMTSL